MCRTEDDALRHDAIANEAPQGDEQLASQGDDHLLARARAFSVRARNHLAKALPFWNSRKRQESWIIPRRTRALLRRILNHSELQLRVFGAPAAVDGVIEGLVHALCFENGAEFSLLTSVGPSWVVLEIELAVFGDLDWLRAIFLDPKREACRLAYPRAGREGRYGVLSREDVTRVAAGLRPLLGDPIPTEITVRLKALAERSHLPALSLSQAVREAAEGLARLAAKALSREELTLAHTSLL
jgi:hypothetical protein